MDNISKIAGLQPAALPMPVTPAMPTWTMPPKPVTPTMPPAPIVPPPPPIIDWVAGDEFTGTAPQREWLVHEWIPMHTVSLLYGDGATGKSLLALQLSVSTVLGQIWLNRIPVQGSVIYFSAEDDRDELHRRLASITQSIGADSGQLANLHIANMAGRDALLAGTGKNGELRPSAILTTLDTQVAIIRPRLVVLDTLADIFPGNENDRAQVRQFIGLLRGIAIRHRCAVLILAHPSLTGINSGTGASGSTAWNNSVRSRLYFERIKDDGYESDPDARRLKMMKSNYGPVSTEIGVRWKQGVFIAQDLGGSIDDHARAERIFLSLLEQCAAQGRYFNTLHAPKQFSEMPRCEGLSKRMLKDAMERLFTSGRIATIVKIENRRERTVIALQ